MLARLSENFRLFLLALQFLSRLPIKIKKPPTVEELASSERYFPLVGLLLGIILAAVDQLLKNYFPLLGINVLLLAVMTIFSGGLHLDGFADCVDAFYSGKSPEKMLEIMKDCHLGVLGGVGLITLFGLQLTFLQVIPLLLRVKVLLIMPLLSRTMMVNVAFFGKYPREKGLGKVYIEGAKAFDWLVALLIGALVCLFFFKIQGIIIFLTCYVFSLLILKFSTRRIAGVTGDVLGLTNELIGLLSLVIIKFLYLKQI